MHRRDDQVRRVGRKFIDSFADDFDVVLGAGEFDGHFVEESERQAEAVEAGAEIRRTGGDSAGGFQAFEAARKLHGRSGQAVGATHRHGGPF
jgi:hypothetical protein